MDLQYDDRSTTTWTEPEPGPCPGTGSNRDEAETSRARETGRDALPLDDPERLGALLAGLRPRMDALALRLTRDPETARDVVQSAFEKVLRHGASFEGRSRVSTWIHRIVSNEALMWLRSERRRQEIHHDPVDPEQVAHPDPSAEPGERIDDHLARRRLHEAIARLPASDQEIVRECSLAGVSYEEYGARAGVHPSAIKSRAFRARRRLRELLAPAFAGARPAAEGAQ